MISEIQIENFKSIAKLSLKPGNVTVLIGENGSGKSNVLEAIAFAAAAAANKLDAEFLHTRGIRVTEQEWMHSKFVPPMRLRENRPPIDQPIAFRVIGTDAAKPLDIKVSRPNSARSFPGIAWHVAAGVDQDEISDEVDSDDFLRELELFRTRFSSKLKLGVLEELGRELVAKQLAAARKRKRLPEIAASLSLRDFLIYSPENTALRNFETEGAIKPLGTKGEGLLKLLSDTGAAGNGKFAKELKSQLGLLGWFGDLRLPTEEDEIRGRLLIHDRWLPADGPVFDQRSANEGFLYLLFYFTLFLSKQTPKFFAIDNIDNALNPKLCAELMRQLTTLAAKTGKQVICTTHNPAILDGMNLQDDQQRLYVVRRNSEGHTVANRVSAPRPRPEGTPIKLSSAFMSGLLGGLPEHF
ncbi:MAG: AAA family ATPase [Verrucomicrobia bacterium]|nr:AAA family ATPase [Verrucomicrobiota bacterium]